MSAGEMAASMAVFELPPRFSLSSHVSTESRYGTNSLFFLGAGRGLPAPLAAAAFRKLVSVDEDGMCGGALLLCSASAEITLPRVVSDLLMLAPSLRRVP